MTSLKTTTSAMPSRSGICSTTAWARIGGSGRCDRSRIPWVARSNPMPRVERAALRRSSTIAEAQPTSTTVPPAPGRTWRRRQTPAGIAVHACDGRSWGIRQSLPPSSRCRRCRSAASPRAGGASSDGGALRSPVGRRLESVGMLRRNPASPMPARTGGSAPGRRRRNATAEASRTNGRCCLAGARRRDRRSRRKNRFRNKAAS